MAREFPKWISAALEERLDGVSRKDLAARAASISDAYRAGGDSTQIHSDLDAIAYASVRMPATYAAVRAALGYAAELVPNFSPRTILDVGAGPGTASWAGLDIWASVSSVSCIDRNPVLIGIAHSLARAASAPRIEFKASLGSLPTDLGQQQTCDLVVASYALTELESPEAVSTVRRLWELTDGMLVIVEPGTPDGFARLLEFRKTLIALNAAIIAPCTHAAMCPLVNASRWCHFSKRLSRSRDHLMLKGGTLPYEDEKFCYLAVTKTFPRPSSARRVLATPRITKAQIALTLCAPSNVEEMVFERRQREGYKMAKKIRWGDAVEP